MHYVRPKLVTNTLTELFEMNFPPKEPLVEKLISFLCGKNRLQYYELTLVMALPAHNV